MNMHPSKEELSDFLLGKLASESGDSVATHLDACAPCQETIRTLDAGADQILAGLRRTRPKTPVDPVCAAALENAARLVPPATLSGAGAKDHATEGPTKVQFLANLQKSGIVSDEQFLALTQSADVTGAVDAAALARKLFETGKLTKFQAEQLFQGKSRGFLFGDYVVLDRLGAGGMGQVFKARHRRMDRVVALKVISGAAMKSADAVKRFQREVKAAARLTHPNIVIAHDAGEQQGVHYLVMEFVDGQDLSARMKRKGPLPVRDAVDVVMQAARGLAFAHGEGVVHRDIKPANLLLDAKGIVKILDLGLARLDEPLGAATDEGLTQSGQVMGTVDYMAPEQAFNTHDATAPADVYSLGCTLYRLLTGQPIFEGQTMVEKIIAHREKPVPSLEKARNDVPDALVKLFEQMVAKNSDERPTMSQVAERLADLAAGMSGKISPPSTIGRPGDGVTELFPSMDSAQPIAVKATALPKGRRLESAAIESKPDAGTPATTAATKASTGGGRKKPPKKVLLAAAGAAALLVALGVWVVVRNKDGESIAQVEVPSGGSTTVQEKPAEFPTVATPKPTASGPAPAPTPQPISFSTPVAPVGGSNTPPPASPPTVATAGFALEFDGEDDLIDLPAFSIEEGPMTIEAWVIGDFTRQETVGCVSGTNRVLSLYLQGPRVGAIIGMPTRDNFQLTAIPPRQSWEPLHIAAVWDGTNILAFANGVGGTPQNAWRNGMDPLEVRTAIGGSKRRDKEGRFAPAYLFRGRITALRFSRTARYATAFQPPSTFRADPDTVALYQFDEGSGDVLKDSSGNNHHGKIVGAKWVRADDSPIGDVTPIVAVANQSGPIELLPLIELDRDVVAVKNQSNEKWQRDADGLVAPGRSMYGRLQVPHHPPADYVIELEVVPTDAAQPGFHLGIPVAGRQVLLRVDDFSSHWTGLELDGQGCNIAEPTARHQGALLSIGRSNTVRIGVRGTQITIAVNGKSIIDWTGEARRFVVHPAWEVPDKKAIFLTSWNYPYRIRRLTLLPLESSPSSAPPPAVAPFDAAQAKAHQEAWAKHLGTTVEKTNSIGMTFVLIPPGEFLMGASEKDIEKYVSDVGGTPDAIRAATMPQRKVKLSRPFALASTETTVGQFRQFVAATNYQTEAERRLNAAGPDAGRVWSNPSGDYFKQGEYCPVSFVSWNDAQEFCHWLSQKESGTFYRLPSEAEWDFANRAGTTTAYYWGDNAADQARHVWPRYNWLARTPDRRMESNAFGLFDMQGNIREWVYDLYGPYPSEAEADPRGPEAGSARTIRGAGRMAYPFDLPSIWRGTKNPTGADINIGFRVARDVLPSSTAGPPSPVQFATNGAGKTPPPIAATATGAATTPGPAPTPSGVKTVIADPNDPIAKKLTVAKTAYGNEIESIRKTVLDSLDRREALARRQADKAAVDQVKAEREAYEQSGDLPKAQWSTLDPRINAAKKTLLAAYVTAVRDYTRGGKDSLADATTREMEAFQKAAGVMAKLAAGSTRKLSQKELLELNREVAAWALGLGARVVAVAPTGQSAELQNGQIPTVPFAVKELHFPANSRGVADADMDKLAPLTTLSHLNLSQTSVTDDGIAKLAGLLNLTYLNTHGRPITDRSFAVIANLKNLKHLDIGWAQPSLAGFDAVAELPNLEIINLFAAAVSDEGLRKLTSLRKLRSLEVKNRKISPETYNYLELSIPGLKIAR